MKSKEFIIGATLFTMIFSIGAVIGYSKGFEDSTRTAVKIIDNNKWYRVTCNKHKGGTAMSLSMLLTHLDEVGFRCNNNDANISIIKNKEVIKALNRMKDELK